LEEERKKGAGSLTALREEEERRRKQMEEAFNRKILAVERENEEKMKELRAQMSDQK
jgi:hypothetical protein